MTVLTPPNSHDPDAAQQVVNVEHKDLLGKNLTTEPYRWKHSGERDVRDAAIRRLRESLHHCGRRGLRPNFLS